jgi:hypothetical protein
VGVEEGRDPQARVDYTCACICYSRNKIGVASTPKISYSIWFRFVSSRSYAREGAYRVYNVWREYIG